MNNFASKRLVFTDDMIISPDSLGRKLVMHRWEDELMRLHAEKIAHGSVLEIGFGMGLAAQHIQDIGVHAHFILEIHPEIFRRAQDWAADYPNVVIMNWDWLSLFNTKWHSKFNGIFIDTFKDPNRASFAGRIGNYMAPGCVVTMFNTLPYEGNYWGFEDGELEFEEIPIDPPRGQYVKRPVYFLPTYTKDN